MSVKLLALHLGLPFAFEENVLGAEVTVDDALPGTPLGLLAEGSEAPAEVLHHRQGIRLPHPGDGAQELVPKLTRLLGAGLRVWYLTAAQKLLKLQAKLSRRSHLQNSGGALNRRTPKSELRPSRGGRQRRSAGARSWVLV